VDSPQDLHRVQAISLYGRRRHWFHFSTHAATHNTFNIERRRISRTTLRPFRAESAAAWAASV